MEKAANRQFVLLQPTDTDVRCLACAVAPPGCTGGRAPQLKWRKSMSDDTMNGLVSSGSRERQRGEQSGCRDTALD
jgi:hypothetical protein